MTRGAGLVKALVGITVLVVDEDAEARELLEAVLSYCGALVVLATSAREAVMLFQRTHVDAVVASITLPDRDAFRLARELHHVAGADSVPVVAVAGRDIADDSLREGFAAYVRRPLEPWEFCRVIATVARKA